jgi:hypothetical protein
MGCEERKTMNKRLILPATEPQLRAALQGACAMLAVGGDLTASAKNVGAFKALATMYGGTIADGDVAIGEGTLGLIVVSFGFLRGHYDVSAQGVVGQFVRG